MTDEDADRFPDLPPLASLRAFEAAARRLSFTAAAEDLRITQSAVSHQIRTLEDHFGTKLFDRLSPGLALTEDGRLLHEGVRDGLERIFLAAERVRARRRVGVLTVSAPAAFATGWLVPRLGRFASRHPDIELRLAVMNRDPDFAADGIDVAVVTRDADAAAVTTGATAHAFLHEDVFPVCSPSFGTIAPADLTRLRLIQPDRPDCPEYDWGPWLNRLGVRSAPAVVRLPDLAQTLAAAVDGIGVALASASFVDAELAAGRLVRPFGVMRMKASRLHAVLWPLRAEADQRVAAFRRFLIEEARAPDLSAGPRGIPPSPRDRARGRYAWRRFDRRVAVAR